MPGHRQDQPSHPGWLYNFEEQLPLVDGIKLLDDIVTRLKTEGSVTIQGHEVSPADPATFIVRLEQTPHHLRLKLELEWSGPEGHVGGTRALPDIK